jgi:hypothetical protein
MHHWLTTQFVGCGRVFYKTCAYNLDQLDQSGKGGKSILRWLYLWESATYGMNVDAYTWSLMEPYISDMIADYNLTQGSIKYLRIMQFDQTPPAKGGDPYLRSTIRLKAHLRPFDVVALCTRLATMIQRDELTRILIFPGDLKELPERTLILQSLAWYGRCMAMADHYGSCANSGRLWQGTDPDSQALLRHNLARRLGLVMLVEDGYLQWAVGTNAARFLRIMVQLPREVQEPILQRWFWQDIGLVAPSFAGLVARLDDY